MSVEPIAPYLEPLRKAVVVPCTPTEAFALFAGRMAEWWPLARGYSVFGASASTCGIQPWVGGEVYEVSAGGDRAVWGQVIAWEQDRRLELTWFPGRTRETAQIVEVRFEPVPEGTRVELEHRNWQTLRDRAAETRQGYDSGWNAVLALFAEYAAEARPAS